MINLTKMLHDKSKVGFKIHQLLYFYNNSSYYKTKLFCYLNTNSEESDYGIISILLAVDLNFRSGYLKITFKNVKYQLISRKKTFI
jgi:hypothetical protein